MMDSDNGHATTTLKKLEIRQAVDDHRAMVNARLVDLCIELRTIAACLRDISDVLHAQYYGEHPGEDLGEEGEPGNDAQ